MTMTKQKWAGIAATTLLLGLSSTAAFAATTHHVAGSTKHTTAAPTASAHAAWHGHHRGGMMMRGQLAAIAKDLNLSATTLGADLKAGQSIASIAKAQNVPTATLISDLEAAAQTKLTSMVTSGKITSAKEQQMQTRMDQMITNFVNGTMPQWSRSSSGAPSGMMTGWSGGMKAGWHGHHHGGMMMRGQLAAIAKDLNLSATTLGADLKAGQSIASIAKAQNVPTATLISDLEAAVQTKLTRMVTSGKITSAKEQQMQTRMDQMITNFVNGTMPQWGGPGGTTQQG